MAEETNKKNLEDERVFINMANDVKGIVKDVGEIKENLKQDYVTKQFLENENLKLSAQIEALKEKVALPIRLIYGACGVALLAVLSFLVSLAVNK